MSFRVVVLGVMMMKEHSIIEGLLVDHNMTMIMDKTT